MIYAQFTDEQGNPYIISYLKVDDGQIVRYVECETWII
jgi:hypothetical protein